MLALQAIPENYFIAVTIAVAPSSIGIPVTFLNPDFNKTSDISGIE